MQLIKTFFIFLFCSLSFSLWAQPPLNDVIVVSNKPEEFENKVFKSEKTGQKKFNLPRRFIQNTGSHFNYYFNANEKLKNIFATAKENFKDNFDELLPFYGYDLNAIAQNTTEIDSVIYKSTAGIIFHDLRTNWIDNFYLLIGKAYMLRKEYDSAAITFQFINYQFAQGKDGSSVTIGSNDYGDDYVPSIATKEKRNIIDKMFSMPPSRNDALIWQVRNYIESGDYATATSLLQVLDNDPFYPKRLKAEVNEQFAYLFYKLGNYDSAAVRLKRALPVANTKLDKSRWQYLLGQLMTIAKNYEESAKAYSAAIKLTNDPLMNVYARIQMIRNEAKSNPTNVDGKINDLIKLTRKDDFKPYKDVIYYTLGEIELERNRIPEAMAYFEKCIKNSNGQSKLKNKAFSALLNFAIKQKEYVSAANFGDSLMLNKADTITDKVLASQVLYLPQLREQLLQIAINDSLVRIGQMTETERNAKVKVISKLLRKEKGLKEDAVYTGTAPIVTNLFETSTASFYFDNANLRTKGFNEFKSRWGNRPNLDNWRRKAALNGATAKDPLGGDLSGFSKDGAKIKAGISAIKLQEALKQSTEVEDLIKNIPVTPVQMDSTTAIIATAHLEAAKLKILHPEDFEGAIVHLEYVIAETKLPSQKKEAYEMLFYVYKKMGNMQKANQILQTIKTLNPESNIAKMSDANAIVKSPETELYKNIYDLYLQGDFEKAQGLKKQADSTYGKSFWTPQLLYIEAVYFVKSNQDSLAKANLQNIIEGNKEPVLTQKAETLLNVLSRRKEIESYLNKLDIKPKETAAVTTTTSTTVATTPIAAAKPTIVRDSMAKAAAPVTTTKKPEVAPTTKAASGTAYTFDSTQSYTVIVMYKNIDAIYLGEAKRAFEKYNNDYHASKNLGVITTSFGTGNNATSIASFQNGTIAMSYMEEIRKYAKSEILTWLTTDKYTFSLISNTNLTLLNTAQNWNEYDSFIKKMMPGRLK